MSIVPDLKDASPMKMPPRPQTSMGATRLDVDNLVGVLANRPGRKSPHKKNVSKIDEEMYATGKNSQKQVVRPGSSMVASSPDTTQKRKKYDPSAI